MAALVGGTLLNLAARAISAQALLPPEQRKPVTLVVDEFHTIPGADYEQVLGELAKYGANVMLATQTLSRLDRLTDAQRTRNLRASVFSNLDGLFAFHTSAEDAAYLAEELGGGLDAQDLLELGHYQCYARLTDVRTGERLPTFSVQLDPPPVGRSTQLAAALARLSAEQYGRDALDVELDLQSALERIRGPQKTSEGADQENAAPEPAPDGSGLRGRMGWLPARKDQERDYTACVGPDGDQAAATCCCSSRYARAYRPTASPEYSATGARLRRDSFLRASALLD